MGRFEGKTEKATPRRRQEARGEGQIARSQEVAVAATLLAGVGALHVFGPSGFEAVRSQTALILSSAESAQIHPGLLIDSAARMTTGLAVPFMAAAFTAAVVAGVAQVGFAFRPKAARPKLSYLSPKRALERFRPSAVLWEFTRSVAKLGLLVAVLWSPVNAWTSEVMLAKGIDQGLADAGDQLAVILWRAVLLAALIAAADYFYNRRQINRGLRMSKEEVKQEHKSQEGDPLVRGQRRRRALELSRNRMIRDVAGADVVVTNPTHLAVALRYGPRDPAPRVIAKGADLLAAKIRGEAYRHGVLVTEDKPLARMLYRRCKVGAYVPAALYEAVAIVLAMAYRRYGRVVA